MIYFEVIWIALFIFFIFKLKVIVYTSISHNGAD